jgi:hypothetical protein
LLKGILVFYPFHERRRDELEKKLLGNNDLWYILSRR